MAASSWLDSATVKMSLGLFCLKIIDSKACQMDGWMDEYVDGWVNGWMDGLRCFLNTRAWPRAVSEVSVSFQTFPSSAILIIQLSLPGFIICRFLFSRALPPPGADGVKGRKLEADLLDLIRRKFVRTRSLFDLRITILFTLRASSTCHSRCTSLQFLGSSKRLALFSLTHFGRD